jgi:hypothetical protein
MPNVLKCGIAVALLAAGCAVLKPRPETAAWPLPDPGQAPFEDRLLQDVELARGATGGHFLAVLERSASGVTLAALDPTGRRLALVRWTAGGLDTVVAPEARPYFDADAALRELAFALWPSPSLEEAWRGGPYRLENVGDRRRVFRSGRLLWSARSFRESGARVIALEGPDGVRIRVRDLPSEEEAR